MQNFRLLAIVFLFLTGCSQEMDDPIALEAGSGFDLAQVTFDENVPQLYSLQMSSTYDYTTDTAVVIPDSLLRYTISTLFTDLTGFDIPAKEFGFLYKGHQLDSMTRLENAYFNSLHTLTDLNKKPVAFYAEKEFDNANDRKKCVDLFIEKNGLPKYAFYIGNGFNVCFYEWVLADRTVQIETSHGFGVTASSDGSHSSGKYYRFNLLIIDNNRKADLYNAHKIEIPETFLHDGKILSRKAIGFDKIFTAEDDFLLNSTNEVMMKNESGMYDISRGEED